VLHDFNAAQHGYIVKKTAEVVLGMTRRYLLHIGYFRQNSSRRKPNPRRAMRWAAIIGPAIEPAPPRMDATSGQVIVSTAYMDEDGTVYTSDSIFRDAGAAAFKSCHPDH
jgi:hypothetical protein